MLHKLIIALLLISGFAYGQSTSGWSIVTTQGTNLYQDGVLLAEGITNSFTPSYGSFAANMSPFLVATNYTAINAGSIVGTISNIWEEDGTYLVLNEKAGPSGAWKLDFIFTNSTPIAPRVVTYHGHYDGSAAHEVKVQAYDFTNSVYSNFTAEVTDIPSTTVDATYQFTFPEPAINFTDVNGAVIVRIDHIDNGVNGHVLNTDFVELIYATAIATNAGVWYDFAAGMAGQSNNITLDVANSRIITTSEGDYEWKWYMSFTGLAGTEFHIRHLSNGVPSAAESIRTIGSSSSIGSMSAFGGGRLPSGATNSFQLKAAKDNAWFSLVAGAVKIKKEAK